MCKEEAKTFSQ